MTLLPTIPRRPGFIAHQSGERLVEGAELELILRSPQEPKRCCTYKINTGTRIQRGATCRRRRRCRGEDSVLPRIQITLIRGGIQWGAILSKTNDGEDERSHRQEISVLKSIQWERVTDFTLQPVSTGACVKRVLATVP